MSEEEKKAIEDLRVYVQNFNEKQDRLILRIIDKQKEEIERLKNAEDYAKLGKETLLDTIHKQQKEIEELKILQVNLQIEILTNFQ